jgi:hypothetical protein
MESKEVEGKEVTSESNVMVFTTQYGRLDYVILPRKEDLKSVEWAYEEGLMGKELTFRILLAAVLSSVKVENDMGSNTVIIEFDVEMFRECYEALDIVEEKKEEEK